MIDLIERLELADAPSRELDLAISTALNTGRSTDPRNPGPLHYTASIDAAMTLVPEGWSYVLRATFVELKHPRFHLMDVEAKAATTAIALVIAALRAKEAGHG